MPVQKVFQLDQRSPRLSAVLTLAFQLGNLIELFGDLGFPKGDAVRARV